MVTTGRGDHWTGAAREPGTEDGKVQYDHFELGGTYLYVKGAAGEIPWDEVPRPTVDDHQVGITVPHLRRRIRARY
ncbi:hypothetical protein [Streptomyces sp. NPDC057748]|uniref:hypothetical protein n=1 Tax=unclassified Streptomyces TaxID=2593676 RepID=UPI0036B51150